MADYPALPLWTDASLADTGHLTFEEHGAYLRLLILMWRAPECRVPNDPAWIARHLQIDAETYDRVVAPVVAEFCKNSGNFLTQKRLKKERAYLLRQSKLQSARRKSLNSKKTPPNPMPTAGHNPVAPPHPHPHPHHLSKKENNSSSIDTPTPAREPAAAADLDRLWTEVGKRVLDLVGDSVKPLHAGRVRQWLADGCDPDLDIYPTVERLMARRGGDPPGNLSYFEQAVADAKASRLKPMPAGNGANAGGGGEQPQRYRNLTRGFDDDPDPWEIPENLQRGAK